MRALATFYFLLTLCLVSDGYAHQRHLRSRYATCSVQSFREFISDYNAQALTQVWSLDLERVFSLVDPIYCFHPKEHHYLFEFEMPVRLEMRKQFIATYFLKPGDSALDIGAFLGTYSFFYNYLVTNAGSVMAFEPNPTAFHALREMISQRGNLNIQLKQNALSKIAGEKIVMEVHPGTLYQNCTVEVAFMNRTAGSNALIEVETESLDHLFDTFSDFMQRLKVIKIDAEGHETAILEGGRNLLDSIRPVIIFEFGVDPGIFEPRSIQVLEDRNYLCYDLMSMERVRPGYQHWTGTDLLAVPVEKQEEFDHYILPLLLSL